MVVGIYISGLEHTSENETVEKYAARYVKELENATFEMDYYTKIEKIYYNNEQSSLVIKIFEHAKETEKSDTDKLVYKLYDFEYSELLNQNYQNKSLLIKNISLFLLVLRRFPRILVNLFKKSTYQKGGKTIYLFFMFLIMSLAVLSLLPLLIMTFDSTIAVENLNTISPKNGLDLAIKYGILLTITFILFMPESNIILTKIAAECITLEGYIQNKEQKQNIRVNLDNLVDYIVQHETNKKIHFHTYSFGSIIALDTLFPIDSEPTKNIQNRVNLLVTIGAPYEFINNYYPNFYKNRKDSMTKKIQWINVYSLLDAFASNFRYDNKAGEANFGILNNQEIPININYENNRNVFDFFALKQIYMHESYWDDSKSGQSCTRLIFFKMKEIGQWSAV
ncbi:hypothetical protein [Flavobacterium facile]|uniref:hypothetical protein n=1 Tax=Flavobacterium facile TaxID=2893174 RepID=UPI002E7798A9|nr:hypothetical protein [Flavobacterium sp. T-12]